MQAAPTWEGAVSQPGRCGGAGAGLAASTWEGCLVGSLNQLPQPGRCVVVKAEVLLRPSLHQPGTCGGGLYEQVVSTWEV